ncbi:MAG: response regulator transcription factor [Christensenella sp.]
MSRIFVIEDEEAINKLICTSLTVAGYETVPAYDGREALDMLHAGERFDLALLDIMLPEVDGFALLPHLRERNVPVIYLTAKNDIESKVQGLTSGAEDYIVKPFEILELIVRMDKVLQRTGAAQKRFCIGDIELHTDERAAYRRGVPLPLKPLEFDLLTLLIKNKNIALSRERIMAAVWGDDYLGETRTVDVHIAQLRKKTGLSIVSLPKIGYRLED